LNTSNWAGNVRYSTGNVLCPTSVEQVQQIVRRYDKLRALGTGHSFNTIADSEHSLLSLRALNRVVSLDRSANTVTVDGGMNYGELAEPLYRNGYALHNLASLPHISIAGACATATHGWGVRNGNLATSVAAIEFVDAAGEVIQLSRRNDAWQFHGAVVGLGALGIVTRVTLDLEPTFDMKQVVYLDLPMQELAHDFDAIMSSGTASAFSPTGKTRTSTRCGSSAGSMRAARRRRLHRNFTAPGSPPATCTRWPSSRPKTPPSR
jgi:xylitol oxidase